jgi:hypothetical protein
MTQTRDGIPLWVYYERKTPIIDLDKVQEDNLYFMLERGMPCEPVFILEKDISKNRITVQTLQERRKKEIDLYKFQKGVVKFYENEIDP